MTMPSAAQEAITAPRPVPDRLLPLLRSMLPALRAGEQKVARFLIERPEDVRDLGILELAERSGVSEATVMRLCHALGCRGYTDLKVRLIEELAMSRLRATAFTGETAGAVQEGDPLPIVVRKVLRTEIQALVETMDVLDTDQLAAAVALLVQARWVECYGVGGSGPIAQDAAYRLVRVGVAASSVTDPHLQVIRAALLGPDDVVLGISHTGETRDTLDALAVAHDAGARTIAITSFPHSTVARAVDARLLTAAIGNHWQSDAITTRIAQLSLIDALCVAIQMQRMDQTETAVARIERGLEYKRHPRRLPSARASRKGREDVDGC